MEYTVEFDINTFHFWSGAYDRMQTATDEQIEAVEQRIYEYYSDRTPTECEINDLVWFECDDIFFPKKRKYRCYNIVYKDDDSQESEIIIESEKELDEFDLNFEIEDITHRDVDSFEYEEICK